MADKIINIEELIQDDLNFNRGTKRGGEMVDHSLAAFGAGRSILIDKNNRVIAGNKTTQAAIKAGIKKVRIVEVSGDKLVAVKRSDVDIDTKKGREFALADNLTAIANFDIDYDKVREAMERVELHPEIWDVPIPNTEGNETSRHSAGQQNTSVRLNCFKVGVYEIVMTPQESQALNEKAEEYRKKNGSMDGFISYLIDEYNERRGL